MSTISGNTKTFWGLFIEQWLKDVESCTLGKAIDSETQQTNLRVGLKDKTECHEDKGAFEDRGAGSREQGGEKEIREHGSRAQGGFFPSASA